MGATIGTFVGGAILLCVIFTLMFLDIGWRNGCIVLGIFVGIGAFVSACAYIGHLIERWLG